MDGGQPVSMSLLPAELREQCSGKGRDELPSHEATQSSRCHRLALNLLFFTAVCVWEGGGGISGTRLSGRSGCYAQSNLVFREYLSVATLKKMTFHRAHSFHLFTVTKCCSGKGGLNYGHQLMILTWKQPSKS